MHGIGITINQLLAHARVTRVQVAVRHSPDLDIWDASLAAQTTGPLRQIARRVVDEMDGMPTYWDDDQNKRHSPWINDRLSIHYLSSAKSFAAALTQLNRLTGGDDTLPDLTHIERKIDAILTSFSQRGFVTISELVVVAEPSLEAPFVTARLFHTPLRLWPYSELVAEATGDTFDESVLNLNRSLEAM